MDERLYVVTAIANPARYKSRYSLYRDFAKRVADAGAILVTVEAAFGDRPHEVTYLNGPGEGCTSRLDVQVRTNHEIWHKENLLNLGIQRLPADWKYVAWIDADVTFARPDWVSETIHQLQHYPVVQLFSEAIDLSPTHSPFQRHYGFCAQYAKAGFDPNKYRSGYTFWHPGFAWAATREAIDEMGGLIDWSPLGAADNHMATALIGRVDVSINAETSDGFQRSLHRWQEKAKALKGALGYVEGLLLHHWHGRKRDRRYVDRWKILTSTGFDPDHDLKRDSQGLWQLTDRLPHLRHLIRDYFRSRNEDSIDIDYSEYNF